MMFLMSMICRSGEWVTITSRGRRTHVTYVFVLEPGQDFDFPQSPLTVGLVLERRDLFDGHPFVFAVSFGDRGIDGRPADRCVSRGKCDNQDLHNHAIGTLPDVLQVSVTRTDLKDLSPNGILRHGWGESGIGRVGETKEIVRRS